MILDGVELDRQGRIFVDREWFASGVTEQFTDNAATYHDRYFLTDHWMGVLRRAFELAEISTHSPLRVLDVGSGSGNTVVTSAHLLPNATIVASDISPQLLSILGAFVSGSATLADRVSLYCFDLHKPFFRPETFDLVVGGAVLHHMVDPKAALLNVVRSVKPGGKVLMFEPLEPGAHMIAVLFQLLVDDLEGASADHSALITLLKAIQRDIEARVNPPVQKPWTQYLDDKWLFSVSYLRSLANELGVTSVEVHPIREDASTCFEDFMMDLLTISGNKTLPVPESAWQLIRDFDRSFAASIKDRVTPEGVIIFVK